MQGKKIYVIFLVILAVLIVVGISLYFFYYKKIDNQIFNKESELFNIVENKNNIILKATPDLMPGLAEQYQSRINKIEEILKNKENLSEEDLQANYTSIAMYKSYLGEYEEAYNYIIKNLEMTPENRLIWISLGELLVKMRACQSAEIALNKAKSINEYDDQIYIKIANAYTECYSDNFEKIKSVYEAGLAKNYNSSIMNEYDDWLYAQNKYNEAIAKYEELIKMYPANKEVIERRIEEIKNKNIR